MMDLAKKGLYSPNAATETSHEIGIQPVRHGRQALLLRKNYLEISMY
jgi:hypothetical protein